MIVTHPPWSGLVLVLRVRAIAVLVLTLNVFAIVHDKLCQCMCALNGIVDPYECHKALCDQFGHVDVGGVDH